DTKLQNTWIEILRREGGRSLAMMEEINGCPHEEGVDYPLGQVCPACPFWAKRQRPDDRPATSLLTAIASYKPDQWEALLASAADRENLEDTWEQWNAGVEKVIAKFEAKGIPYVRVPLDIEEIKQFCEEQGIPNDGKARVNLAIRKAEQNKRQCRCCAVMRDASFWRVRTRDLGEKTYLLRQEFKRIVRLCWL